MNSAHGANTRLSILTPPPPDSNKGFLTKHIVINAGHHISYQCHHHRTEIWTFIEGCGELVTDGVSKKVEKGDHVYIPQGMKHAVKAYTELHIIETQLGDDLQETDIEKFDWDWNS